MVAMSAMAPQVADLLGEAKSRTEICRRFAARERTWLGGLGGGVGADEVLVVLAAGRGGGALVSGHWMRPGCTRNRRRGTSGSPGLVAEVKAGLVGGALVIRDALRSPGDYPWVCARMRRSGERAAIIAPIAPLGTICGVLRAITHEARDWSEAAINAVMRAAEREADLLLSEARADAAEHAARHLGAALSALPEPVALVCDEGVVHYCNKAMLALLGGSRARPVGRKASALLRSVFGREAATQIMMLPPVLVSRVDGRRYAVEVMACGDGDEHHGYLMYRFAPVPEGAGGCEGDPRYRALAARMTQAEHDLRNDIGQALHNDIAGGISAALMKLGEMARSGEPCEKADELRGMLREAADTARRLSRELAPVGLHEAGLASAVNALAEKTTEENGTRVQVIGEDARFAIAREVRYALYRAVQELVANGVRHGRAANIAIAFRSERGRLQVQVNDDGVGFVPDVAPRGTSSGTHLGILYVRDRIEALGGELALRSAPGKGTQATILVPTLEAHARRKGDR